MFTKKTIDYFNALAKLKGMSCETFLCELMLTWLDSKVKDLSVSEIFQEVDAHCLVEIADSEGAING